jgi:radical SAM protein with 4Fe4S-binding SPASM domain
VLLHRNTLDIKKLFNRVVSVSDFITKKSRTRSKPLEIILEVTNFCNLDCIMCPRTNMIRDTGFMTLELFKKIIDQVESHAELVYLSGGLGDPMLHPDIGSMIQYGKSRGVIIGVSTNATMLNDKNINMLLESQTDILLLSLDGATKETHESIRVGSVFEKTMGGVEKFLTEKERRGLDLPYAVCQMIYMPENKMEAEEFKKKWSTFAKADEVRLKKYLNLQGADKVPENSLDSKSAMRPKASCILPWRQLSIGWDGTVSFCCRDTDFKESMGNVHETSIDDVWNSKKMMQYRESLSNSRKSEISICKGCAGIKSNVPTLLGSALFDDLSIRKLLPFLERLVLKTGIKMVDYD